MHHLSSRQTVVKIQHVYINIVLCSVYVGNTKKAGDKQINWQIHGESIKEIVPIKLFRILDEDHDL